MAYSAADESFTHQLPVTFDQVHDPDPTWSDRCYFFAASPDGSLLLASGYGNNPNTGTGMGYVKVSMADGRHWDLLAGRPVTGTTAGSSRPDRCAGRVSNRSKEVAPGCRTQRIGHRLGAVLRADRPDVGTAADEGARRDGEMLADMYPHEGARTLDRLGGDRRRAHQRRRLSRRTRPHLRVRVADKIDFWLWLDAGFGDCAIGPGSSDLPMGQRCTSTAGSPTMTERCRAVRQIEHDVEFDGDRKRPAGPRSRSPTRTGRSTGSARTPRTRRSTPTTGCRWATASTGPR